MQKHDRSYLCGDCVQPSCDSNDVIEFVEVEGYDPVVRWLGHDLTLLEAASMVGKSKSAAKTAIVDSSSSYSATLEVFFG